MGFPSQEYWNGLPFPSFFFFFAISFCKGIFPIQESNLHLLCLLHWQVDSLPLYHWEALRWNRLGSKDGHSNPLNL